MKRKVVQFLFAVLNNSYFFFPFTRTIYQGKLKYFCAPGLNCYSCPASAFSCPLGALQNFFSTFRVNLATGVFQPGFVVIGFLGIIGTLGGRIVCGWACPFGLFQELLYKIPLKKFKMRIKSLRYLKYAVLCFTIIILPLFLTDKFGYGEAYFCRYLCPAGTLEAGLTLPFLIPSLTKLIGWLYYYKVFFLVIFCFSFIFLKRPFCRFFCPLGAIYAFFNKFSYVKLKKNIKKCNECLICEEICPMELTVDEIPDSVECIRCFNCVKVCPGEAVKIVTET
jgi:polyferredoxin